MDSGSRGRTNLWLRAERALGLDSVPLRVEKTIAAAFPASPARIADATLSSTPMVEKKSHAGAKSAPVTSSAKDLKKPPVDLIGKPVVATKPFIPPAVSRAPFATPVLPVDQKRFELEQLDVNFVKGCTRCRLCETRTQTVFGEGDADARIFFVGEGPGENEDLTGRPFVGRAGQLLDKMIAGMGLKREQVFIANIVKCRPPGNRVPQPDEADTCMPYLDRQIEIVRPTVIVTLGLSSAKYLLQDSKLAMGKIRGRWTQWRGIQLMPTFHPSYVLRVYTPEVRGMVWDDLKLVMDELGLPKTRDA